MKVPSLDPVQLGPLSDAVAKRLVQLDAARIPARIWAKDPTVWKDDPQTPEIRDRLGWLAVGEAMMGETGDLEAFAAETRSAFRRVVVCGMGGSSLAPEMLGLTFGPASGYPSFVALDSTDPRAVAAIARSGELDRTLFIISSKSGTTLEPDCFLQYFWELTGHRGSQFAAITDPGTPLARLAAERGFRRSFTNPPDIGGRYSALSYFGLVPGALLGMDLARLLQRAGQVAAQCGPAAPAAANPGALLGAVLGEAALTGRDKVTFVLSPAIESLGLWLEQLIAESTGKEGKGIVPVAGEPLGAPDVYGEDRVFVALTLAGERDPARESRLAALSSAGQPVVRHVLQDSYDVGGEFFRWEFATAVAGAILRINPFDQPNVAESKTNTEAVLKRRAPPSPAASSADVDRFLAAITPGDYLALMAYLPPTPAYDRRLSAIRARLRDRLKVATTLGYGPRYLHSTGQMHKGGPPTGHFLQITEPVTADLTIPGKPFTFGELEAAQAEGDLIALRGRGRPALRLDGLALLER